MKVPFAVLATLMTMFTVPAPMFAKGGDSEDHDYRNRPRSAN
jgi:hypothetical protein